MVGTRDKRSPVLVKAGAVVAAGALTVGFLLVACSGTPGPETAPAPSDAPDLDDSVVAEAGNAPSPSQTSIVTDDGASTDSSADVDSVDAKPESAEDPVDAKPESAEPVDAKPESAEDPVDAKPESAEDPVDAKPESAEPVDAKPESAEDPVDAKPEFLVEIVEELAPTEPAGGARQDEPVEPVGPEESEGTGGSGRTPSAQGDVYTWHDGDRMIGARLQLDLEVITEGAVAPSEDVVADMGGGQVVTRSAGGSEGVQGASGSDGASTGHPVFLSESGELMALPGGVILVLDEDWDSSSVDGFFARNGISLDRVSELDYVTNGFLVETDPGFASLDLANALATQAGVELSSPNWWRERTAR